MRSNGAVKIIYGTVLRETEKAILISPDIDRHGLSYEGAEPDRSCWLPLSQVTKIVRKNITSPTYKLDKDELTITAWIYGQKGFETFPEGHKWQEVKLERPEYPKRTDRPANWDYDMDDDIPF